MGLHELPDAIFVLEHGAPTRRNAAAIRQGDGEGVVAQPMLPALNASVSAGRNVARPPPPSISLTRKSRTAAPPLKTSDGSLPMSRVPSLSDTWPSTSDASPRDAAANHASTRASSSSDRSTAPPIRRHHDSPVRAARQASSRNTAKHSIRRPERDRHSRHSVGRPTTASEACRRG